MMTRDEITKRALEIAGCCWSDREHVGTLADQLRTVAATPAVGSDGDPTNDDREALLMLAVEADEHDADDEAGITDTERRGWGNAE